MFTANFPFHPNKRQLHQPIRLCDSKVVMVLMLLYMTFLRPKGFIREVHCTTVQLTKPISVITAEVSSIITSSSSKPLHKTTKI